MKHTNFHSFFCINYRAELGRHSQSKSNMMILESNPDILYYGDNPLPEIKATPYEHHLFALTEKNECIEDESFRFINDLEQKYNKTLHIYRAQITLGNDIYTALRFRENELTQALEFADYLIQKHNVKFKKDKRFSRKQGKIHYRKWIDLEMLHEDIFKDSNSRHIYLIKIPTELNLEEFYTVMDSIMHSYCFASFEPFYVYVLTNHYEIVPFVMIYSPHCNMNKITEFKKELHKEIKRIK